MNIFLYIIIGIVGIWLGSHFAKATRDKGLFAEQSKRKTENKEKILALLRTRLRKGKNFKLTNNDIEKLLGVSDATATRYMDELEKEQKVRQIGKTGNAVYYILK